MAISKKKIGGKETAYVEGVYVVDKEDLDRLKQRGNALINEYKKKAAEIKSQYPRLSTSIQNLWWSLYGITIPTPPAPPVGRKSRRG